MKTDNQAILQLLSVPKIGNQRLRNLITEFKSPESVLNATRSDLMRIKGFSKELSDTLLRHDGRKFAENQINLLEKTGSVLITFWDDKYPALLKNIYDPPVVLFYKGSINLNPEWTVGIVGTRTPTNYGKTVAKRLAEELIRSGFTIISGFARGIDSIAHKSACDMNGTTVAVLGNGLDLVYPPENKVLIQPVISHGAFITEFPFGTKPGPGNFPMRNRIIAGMSLGTLVIEAGRKSGALITAMYANDYGREVFAVPGPITGSKSYGTHKLIKSGAKLVETVDDILEEFSSILSVRNESEQQQTILQSLSPEEQKVWNLIAEPVHIDDLSLQLSLPTSKVLSTLLIMELNGYINQLPGKLFVRN